ncbi:MAG TPA: LemA family protein [Candidatus Dormibacteraeota bacterium]|nr:LemA family protein [Candidatus Dormibacteraeota bacterium]
MELAAVGMSGEMITIGIAVLFAVVATAVGSYCIGVYNELVALRSDCDRQFASVDALLKQRHDELPKLIDTCKGYMQHEQKTLQGVTDARSAYMNAKTPGQKTQADHQISGTLKTLFAVAENCPALKADTNFMQLQGRISGLEAQIAGERAVYNETANAYNIRIAQTPANLIAMLGRFSPRPMYPVAATDRQDVKVSFA